MVLARSRLLLAVGVAVCLGGLLFSVGSVPAIARAGEASLEFVGNLINSVHSTSLYERFDPTYPRCF